jgi:hypothetical protein
MRQHGSTAFVLSHFFLAVISGCGVASNGSETNPGNPLATVSISGTFTYKGAPLPGATVTNFLTNSNVVFKTATTRMGIIRSAVCRRAEMSRANIRFMSTRRDMHFIRQWRAARK